MIGEELLRVVGDFRWVWDIKTGLVCTNECGTTHIELFISFNFLCGQISNLSFTSSSCLVSKILIVILLDCSL